jgi:hypothetical protein
MKKILTLLFHSIFVSSTRHKKIDIARLAITQSCGGAKEATNINVLADEHRKHTKAEFKKCKTDSATFVALKGLVELYTDVNVDQNGTLDIISKEGGGAEFIVSLPANGQ